MTVPTRPKIVIVGGGFGGLSAIKALRGANLDVTLIDRRNYHLFQPLLYQVATAALSTSEIAWPIRHLLRRREDVSTVLGTVESIDTARRRVVLADGAEIAYDYLILATGAQHAYFGHDEWAPLAPGLKTLEDATTVRRKLLVAFEAAEQETDPARRQALLTFAIVGAGPTGVELAGAVIELARTSIAGHECTPSGARDGSALSVSASWASASPVSVRCTVGAPGGSTLYASRTTVRSTDVASAGTIDQSGRAGTHVVQASTRSATPEPYGAR